MEEITAGRNVRCCFCNSSEINEVLYGKLYKLKNVSTHYFCMLLSAQIAQNGEDHEGILGFLYDDIISELKRGRTLTCHYCKTRGATLECAHRRCRKVFHLPCGRQKFSLHQFFDSFKTYCGHHRPKQKIDAKVLAATRNRQEDCSICFDSMVIPSPKTLWAPCCRKNSWFHWECIQTLALSAGYFFKCPLCNNKNEFTRAMQQMGIYVPEQDAAWEREPNAYQSLMERHNSCDATVCICPQGRQHFIQHTKWELRLCVTCGSQGMHVGCGGLKNVRSWQCPLCSAVTRKNVNGIAPTVAAAPAVQAPVVAATSSETETVLGSTRRLRSMYGRPVDMPSGVRVTRRGRYPVNNPINNFVNSPANGPVNGPVNVPANGPAISPANGPANSPASGPANSPANGPASSPANGPANSPANGPVNSPVSSPALSTPIRPGPSPTVALGPRCPSSAFIEEKREVITVEDTDEIIDVESSDSEVEILQTCDKRLKDYNGQVLAVTNIKAQGNPREYFLGQDLREAEIACDEFTDTEALRAPEFVPVDGEPFREPVPVSEQKSRPVSEPKPDSEFADTEIEIIGESPPQSGRPSVSRPVPKMNPIHSNERTDWLLSHQHLVGNKRKRTKEPEVLVIDDTVTPGSSLVQQLHPPLSELPRQQQFEEQKTSQDDFCTGPGVVLDSEWPASDVHRRNKPQPNDVWENQVRILDLATINVSDFFTEV